MLEQETASIIKFILRSVGDVSPYYYKIPEGFLVPAVYFPSPEIVTYGDTFQTYSIDYAWPIMFFHKSDSLAYELALKALTAIKESRHFIPLIDENGETDEHYVHLDNPKLKVVDNGSAQLTLYWTSRRPYLHDEAQKIADLDFRVNMR